MTIINPMQLQRKCNSCGGVKTLTVPTMAYEKWKNGEGYVQDLFPMLTPGERELLISGTCEPCFDAMFPEEEDDDISDMGDIWSEEILNEQIDLPDEEDARDDLDDLSGTDAWGMDPIEEMDSQEFLDYQLGIKDDS